MDNRFGIQYLPLDPYLLDLSVDELTDKPVFCLVTDKGKNSDGTLNKDGMLQMYLFDLDCFPREKENQIVCRRREPPEEFTCDNRAQLIEEIAFRLSSHDNFCADAEDTLAESIEEDIREQIGEAKEVVPHIVKIINSYYGYVELCKLISDSKIKKVREYCQEIERITHSLDIDDIKTNSFIKIHKLSVFKRFFLSHIQKIINAHITSTSINKEDVYYIMADILMSLHVMSSKNCETLAGNISRSLKRHEVKMSDFRKSKQTFS